MNMMQYPSDLSRDTSEGSTVIIALLDRVKGDAGLYQGDGRDGIDWNLLGVEIRVFGGQPDVTRSLGSAQILDGGIAILIKRVGK